MQIHPIYNFKNNNNPKITFKGAAEFRKGIALYDYYNTSSFFRPKFDIRNLIRYMENFYKDIPFVRIISHACSEGQEPFSIKFLLMSLLKERANKYLVEGRDFDALNIISAKKGTYTISPSEMARMENECGLDLYKYINLGNDTDNVYFLRYGYSTPSFDNNNIISLKIKDYVREQVPFKKVDILTDDDIPADNTVLLTRNMWPYMPAETQAKLAQKLANTLSPSSHIVIGDFDIANNIHQLLRKAGFEHTEIFEVMKKPDFNNVNQKVPKLC